MTISCCVHAGTSLLMSNKAILIRVGVDQTYGQWNAPCNPDTLDYVYVPIPQSRPNAQGMERGYESFIAPALQDFSARNHHDVSLPGDLKGRRMHLDPDFECMSYGDTVNRGRRLLNFEQDDVVVFYASLRSIHGEPELIYALIGMLVVDSIKQVKDIRPPDFDGNAHTRNAKNRDSDIVVRGKPGFSGRFGTFIPIGEFRNRSYRVKKDLLDAWGDLSVKDGWIQRSANPPIFLDPGKFLRWLESESPSLVASNI